MAPSPKQRLIEELMLALTDLRNAADIADQAITDSLGLNRTDARCLSCLIIRGAMPASELADVAGIKPGALTFAVDRLRAAGFADRAPDPADRRRVIVSASEKAKRLADEVWARTVTEEQDQLDGYTAAQLHLLADFVRAQVTLQRRQADRIRSWNG